MEHSHPYDKVHPSTWEQLQRDCRVLASRLPELGPFAGTRAVTSEGLVREVFPAAYFAMLRAKPMGRDLVDAFWGEVSPDAGLLFPWSSAVKSIFPLVKAGG